jgi:hypothetical protein
MPHPWKSAVLVILLGFFCPGAALAEKKPTVGLIPKAQKPIAFDGKLTDWDGAFVTPVHVGHPDFANRGGQFLYLWDEKNLYIGLKCLDQKPAHVGKDNELYNGDALENRIVPEEVLRRCPLIPRDEEPFSTTERQR